ncbi:MAG: ferrous iron transport protein B [Flavobacteriia bacterium]|nr:ferrous iron transport protein B [Flavobacteriia bacterium]OIP46005.1 MAG: ferrous iron transport protein B [Flavobacteriaceae bacterium CG2_30_31_66]PIV95854.1 MAG: ferrous iron transport protein B [Flavobacteriaceae bacterium CG17_big_fil_post_rev_8_21_14_2_50_31_13]PIX13409.1 MAG: ferrous iron transport protein B [Flavobacteriaceae bacterium CG_4_8_14_3_um_filter_31_8]PIY15339.1 MAG: ferrous iron transport protein B [Flavobacteriaceae bacterium CG_4_10_14_3_um_filter_31_253]PIZ11106.1 MA
MANKPIKVALIGNPNTGKTLLFNQLTGLNQKVGNYPGVTVDKKEGISKLSATQSAIIIDLPGTYSINPTSIDETIVLKTLLKKDIKESPDVILVVADVENLKRNLLLFSQIKDLEIPTVLAINMADQMGKKGISIDLSALKKELNTEVILISAKKNQGIKEVKEAIIRCHVAAKASPLCGINHKIDPDYFAKLKEISPSHSLYELWLMITQNNFPETVTSAEKQALLAFKKDISKLKKYQHKETIYRYQEINKILKKTYIVDKSKASDIRSKLDKIFTHKVFGYVFFFLILMVIFQSIFDWASLPMDLIDGFFAQLAQVTKSLLPAGVFTDLLTDGIIPGVGGVIIFIPQIAILFLFVAILEETGYMSRVVFLMDKIMRRFGMNGKSIIPLISGTACAIPAIMATRTISNWKERLITILVVPFTTCSARLPVYAILIALIIPDTKILGLLNLQGLVLLSLYGLGFGMAILAAFILHKTLDINSKSFFLIEMPNYKLPSLKNVFFEVFEKTKAFVFGAGKIILALSIVLWFLASNGSSDYKNASEIVSKKEVNRDISPEEMSKKVASFELENSYIGMLGKTIEPVIKPLGFDWKIGIALVTSFAAREVFVGTLATIYSVEANDENTTTIKQKMASEVNPDTGEKIFTFPVGMSLLIFYAFAMQCMATLAIVKKETKTWKWPLIQLIGMGVLAYVSSLITFKILS